MTPLDLIKDWFVSLSDEYQHEIAALTGHFHLDERIDLAFEQELKLELFKEYLDTRELTNIEITQRTLFIIKLLDFCFEGRDTETEWTKILDRFLDLRTGLKEKGKDTNFIDEQINKFYERKNVWLDICKRWEELKTDTLNNRQIADWYFFNTKPTK